VAALTAACALAAAPASGSLKPTKRIKLKAVERADAPGELAIRVKSRWRSTVEVEERADAGWTAIASGRPGKRRRLSLTASAPSGAGRVVLRATVPARHAVSRRIRVDLAPTPEPEPEVEAPTPREMPVGFNNNAVSRGLATADQAAGLLAEVGADIDRVQITWEHLERTPGVYDFALSDSIYAADLARGVRPLFILAYAPRWASGSACAGIVGRCIAGPLPDYYDDYARAAAAIAERYPEAAGIEIWNEPNFAHFWRPAVDPEGYASLLRESFSAIRQADPAMPVAGGSLAQLNPEPGSMGAPDFLKRVYEAGAANAMDALAIHAYAGGDSTGERAVTDVADVRATRDAFGDPSTPLWVTETGASTTGANPLSEVDQAARLTLLDSRLRAAADVEMLIVHTLVDPPADPASRETGFGVVRSDLSKKPGYCALALAWGGSAAC
jgi:hypothetical protein